MQAAGDAVRCSGDYYSLMSYSLPLKLFLKCLCCLCGRNGYCNCIKHLLCREGGYCYLQLSIIKVHKFVFSIYCKILPYYIYYRCIFIRAVGLFFCSLFTSFHTHASLLTFFLCFHTHASLLTFLLCFHTHASLTFFLCLFE